MIRNLSLSVVVCVIAALMLSVTWWTYYDDPNKLSASATVVVAFFAIIQSLIFYSQLAASEESTSILKKGQRAYIIGGGPVSVAIVKNDYSVAMHIRNKGATPAFITGIVWGLCPEENFCVFNMPVSKIIEQSLLPINVVENYSDVFEAGHNQVFGRVSFDQRQNAGKIFFAKIDYNDVFGNKCFSTFKLRLLEEPGRSDPLDGCYTDWA